MKYSICAGKNFEVCSIKRMFFELSKYDQCPVWWILWGITIKKSTKIQSKQDTKMYTKVETVQDSNVLQENYHVRWPWG